MGLLTRLRMEFESFFGVNAEAADYEGVIRPKITPLDVRWVDGTSSNKANRAWSDYGATLAAAGTRNLDLRALTNVFGAAVTMAEIRAVGIYVRDTADTDHLDFAKGASNGFTGFGTNFSMRVQRGTWIWLVCPLDGEYPTGASDKVLDITNNSAATVTYDLVVIGTAT